jgi:uncharacterized protein (DUF2132 family)
MAAKNTSNIYYFMKYLKRTKYYKETEISYIVYTSKLRITIIQVYLLVLMIRTVPHTLHFVCTVTMRHDNENTASGHLKLGGSIPGTHHTTIAPC